MDRWVGRWRDGWVGGGTDGWMARWLDGGVVLDAGVGLAEWVRLDV